MILKRKFFPRFKELVDQSVLQIPLRPQPSTPLTHSVASTEQLSSEPLNASQPMILMAYQSSQILELDS